ncbi:MAG: PDZ domain-containing protein [Succinivibrionaceae bacterium]|nr:PDZ domain-containing protein [Succinivibrionaceae bacterium]
MKASKLGAGVALALGLCGTALAVPHSQDIMSLLWQQSYLIRDKGLPSAFDPAAASAAELNAALVGIDPYAHYTDAKTFALLKRLNAGGDAGVGMDLIIDRDKRVRCIPFAHSPADDSGIEYRDRLLSIDGTRVDGMSLEEMATLIRGKEGTEVVLGIEKARGGTATYPVERLKGRYDDFEGSRDGNVRIYRFSPGVAKRLEGRFQVLGLKPGQRIFIDLRGNTGGNLEEGARCAGLFLPRGEILYRLKTRDGIKEVRNERDGPMQGHPLIILTDDLTASASELMIAALRAAGRAGAYGSATAGKGYVQDVFNLPDGAVIKFTTAEMLPPGSDEGWQGKGLQPDVIQN